MNNKVINNLFGKELITAMQELLEEFVALDYDIGTLLNKLKNVNESVRVGLYLMALERNYNSMVLKLNFVNKMLNDERKDKFLEAYKNGEMEKFLAPMGKSDKISLMEDLGVNVDIKGRELLSKENKNYYDILSTSIMDDQVIDARNGIDRFIKYKKEDEKEA